MKKKKILFFAGVCLGGKLSPFSDISKNSTLEKRTLHKFHYEKNGLFAKFILRKTDSSPNSICEKRTLHKIQCRSYLLFSEGATPTLLFLEVKNVPCLFLEVQSKPFPFLEVQSKPGPFSTISNARKPDFCRKSRNAI